VRDEKGSFAPKRWKFCIVVPEINEPANYSFAKSRPLKSASIQTPVGRAFPVYLDADSGRAGLITFYDYAISIRNAYAAIDFAVDQKKHPLATDDLKRIERVNFDKTLRRLFLDRC